MWLDDTPASSVGSKILAAVKHPVWVGAGIVVVVAVALAAVFLPGDSGSSTAEIAELSFGDLTPIKAVDSCGPACGYSLDETPPIPDTEITPVDITIKNTADQPFTITMIEAEILENKNVGCFRAGGGRVISAFYMIKIPAAKQEPTTVSTSVDFTVKPNSSDRMVVSVGPDKLYFDPDATLLRLKLIPKSGTPLITETLAMIPPSAVTVQEKNFRTSNKQCLQETADTLERFTQKSKFQNSGFLDFRKLFTDAL
ncbi:MAG: hypothetical protein QM809_06700 [Gordonia sp. (in: high G+C Gram-positive bacteria)]|uniref:hypothetical protein n=1 Tax=Gordonia sp. (in: high G+C Gram-positive bacteria) TaxID=84139 RepID=UPI0039E2E875